MTPKGVHSSGVRRLAAAILLSIGGLMLMSCGGTSTGSLPTSASATSSASSTGTPLSSPSSSASPLNYFRTNDCVDQPTGSQTAPLGDDFHVVVRVPSGWTQVPPHPTETELLGLDAPSGYSNQPTRIQVLSLMGYFQTETVDQLAPQYYGASLNESVPPVQLVGAVTDCTVAGEPAAFFQYIQGNVSGYLVLFLHFDYLYGLRLEGVGGLDPQAARDARRILGSWGWTVTTPPSR